MDSDLTWMDILAKAFFEHDAFWEFCFYIVHG
jgi:hypothetical protein